jgi:SAM-dependent methyltransferase
VRNAGGGKDRTAAGRSGPPEADQSSTTDSRLPPTDPTRRFSNRAESYAKHRPGYPPELIATLLELAGLSAGFSAADIGSGTGIMTKLLLEAGGRVFAVEPNDAMRAKAEAALAGTPGFRSVAGTAEETTLPSSSVDLVACAQAFHWFDRERARKEFVRILELDGFAAIVWNNRRSDTTPFARDYEALLEQFGTDYRQVGHRWQESYDLALFFRGPFTTRTFFNAQRLDREGLEGRLLSSSYVPAPDARNFPEMMRALSAMFDRHQREGSVQIDYETRLFVGRLG